MAVELFEINGPGSPKNNTCALSTFWQTINISNGCAS
jgi:hypothetical protein